MIQIFLKNSNPTITLNILFFNKICKLSRSIKNNCLYIIYKFITLLYQKNNYYLKKLKLNMNFSNDESTQMTDQKYYERKLVKIIAEKKGFGNNMMYQVEWLIENKSFVGWVSISELANYMGVLAQFKRSQKVSKSTLKPIPQVPQHLQQTNPHPHYSHTLQKSTKNNLTNSALISINNIQNHSPDKYQVQLLDLVTKKLQSMVLTNSELKQNYLEDYVNHLEHEVYYFGK